MMRYSYVGPPELRNHVVRVDTVAVDTAATLARWLAGRNRGERVEPFTFGLTSSRSVTSARLPLWERGDRTALVTDT
ncbi:hypothetical protein ACQP1P_21915 [Dactylosporangium sp. CA-052675]|uniref:hypothetical protein n=1 Tax=Dactylosporangium sp. CA-052675 TaxID=3239927 RepID=UPI003D8A8F68